MKNIDIQPRAKYSNTFFFFLKAPYNTHFQIDFFIPKKQLIIRNPIDLQKSGCSFSLPRAKKKIGFYTKPVKVGVRVMTAPFCVSVLLHLKHKSHSQQFDFYFN